ncbi:4'-phosphopantetheinyl transferase [Clostridium acidisoli DSM 12555]|uniref:4'-phosphopantetheinyl transferase n=1 Tax=Clostridium acidisoli DSM 12555 TaxID=1121291 RepID=A0A1W1XD40_9CLOT|nr:4'-phosphopantetheinyl transferase superfamily protein [Clostridium acidisoli]SMC21813.1 4'-phosphopantetheinyl transferase [Clostridium acidisoli DSM 12555]
MVSTYCVDLDEFKDEEILNDLLNYVSEDKRLRLLRYRFLDDRKRGVVSDLLIRYIINRKLNYKIKDIIFKYNNFGKPYLFGSSEFQYNISHSGKYVVCATSNKAIGVDIENIKPIDMSIIKHVFTKNEYNDFENAEKKTETFYSIWTLKESFVKLIGSGLNIPLNSFCIDGIFNTNTYCKYKDETFYFKQYNIDPDYKLSICYKEKILQDEIKIFKFKNFLKELHVIL